MKIYNTLHRQMEEIQPFNPKSKKIGLYACGPTVYDYAHLGHMRKYTMDDILIRALEYFDFKVLHVQNITDVGHLTSDADTGQDKLEKGAKKYKLTVKNLAKKFEDYFFYAMDLIGNDLPDISCRATEHIQEQLDLVLQLQKKGFTYVIDGDGVYFDTSKVDDYGKLANLDIDNLQEGKRVEKNDQKRNPTDFALWKFEPEGTTRAMAWQSPWHQRSFPGWHIECSAMSMKYLGNQFEIHTGGIDHIPVHHTNEIAQSESASGKKPFVKYWVHHNFLRVEGEKMSKSLDNFYTIDDVVERGFDPKALRLLFFTSHYRSELNFTWKNLAGMHHKWKTLVKDIVNLKSVLPENFKDENVIYSAQAEQLRTDFFNHIADDLKLPQAMVPFWELQGHQSLRALEKMALYCEFDEVLGLGLENLTQNDLAKFNKYLKISNLPSEAQKLLTARKEARQSQQWDKADQLRSQIEALGYELLDTKQGQKVVKKENA